MEISLIADYSTILSTLFALISLIISFIVLRNVNSINLRISSFNQNNGNINNTQQHISGNGNRTAGGTYNE